ncbi:MAG: hypothetical protein IPF99_38310 [Deltaproteobacteria bacterium]|nr:hypothetical protein [Deltaproteobacteria bacterium]
MVHGTAPLLAPMVLVSVAPSLLAHLRRRSLDRASLALLAGVTVACLTGAHGPGASWRCGRTRVAMRSLTSRTCTAQSGSPSTRPLR